MKALEFINKLRSTGRHSFDAEEAMAALRLSKLATLNAVKRLKDKKLIVSPARGFYLYLALGSEINLERLRTEIILMI